MTATTTPLAELMSIVDELRRPNDEKLIAAWRANEAAITQPGRPGGDDQARSRHYAFRLAALERFGLAHQQHLRHDDSDEITASAPALSAAGHA